MISLFESFSNHCLGLANPNDESREDLYLGKLANNEIYAMGCRHGDYKNERIDPEFWKVFRQMRARDVSSDGMQIDDLSDRITRKIGSSFEIIYENIFVYEEPFVDGGIRPTLIKSQGGKPPQNSRWEVTAAEAVRICYEDGLPETRKDFVDSIREAVLKRHKVEPLGDATLEKLVRRIYRVCGRE